MPLLENRHSLFTLVLLTLVVVLAGCSSTRSTSKISAPASSITPKSTPSSTSLQTIKPTLPKAGSGRGGYYLDDGPGESPPPGLELTLDAEPKIEPYSVAGSRPYVVFGKTYTPIKEDRSFSQRGIGSWYGKKFHGKRTSSGELYDMYKMTAAHPTLPIPSYARITNVSNGRQVIVRVNDRGPFHSDRIVDLSYTAALKLDYVHKGSSELLLERLLPADIEKMAENKKNHVVENVADHSTPVPPIAADTAGFEALVAAELVAPSLTDTPNNAGGFYLQFGAFGLRSNAEATFNRLQHQLTQLPAFEIVQQGMLYRLFSGPFASHDEATLAMQLALNAGVPKPVIVQR